jgi:S1-C subfamily serine protease
MLRDRPGAFPPRVVCEPAAWLWRFVAACVIASEPRADISILQVSVVPRDAVVAKLADSDAIRVGDPVFIVDAPYGLPTRSARASSASAGKRTR